MILNGLKKTVIVALALVALSSIFAVPLLEGKPDEPKPLDQIWAAITALQGRVSILETRADDLQTQIINIELTPGPQGPSRPAG